MRGANYSIHKLVSQWDKMLEELRFPFPCDLEFHPVFQLHPERRIFVILTDFADIDDVGLVDPAKDLWVKHLFDPADRTCDRVGFPAAQYDNRIIAVCCAANNVQLRNT